MRRKTSHPLPKRPNKTIKRILVSYSLTHWSIMSTKRSIILISIIRMLRKKKLKMPLLSQMPLRRMRLQPRIRLAKKRKKIQPQMILRKMQPLMILKKMMTNLRQMTKQRMMMLKMKIQKRMPTMMMKIL